jgi:hypothetical protein
MFPSCYYVIDGGDNKMKKQEISHRTLVGVSFMGVPQENHGPVPSH